MPKTPINMHRFRFLGIAFTLLGSLALSSCQDHLISTPTPARFRLASYSFNQNKFFYIANFTYGSSGKVTSYAENYYASKYTNTLTYNEKGQLIRLDKVPSDGNPYSPGNYSIYTYDQAGNLAKRTRYKTKGGLNSINNPYFTAEVVSFEYGANAPYPSRISQAYYNEDGTVSDSNQLELTYQNGNVVRSVRTYTDNRYAPVTIDYQFDDKPNPFYNFVGAPDGFEDYPYNRNNITSNTRVLTYDSNGFITKLLTQKNDDPAFQGINTYTYEQY